MAEWPVRIYAATCMCSSGVRLEGPCSSSPDFMRRSGCIYNYSVLSSWACSPFHGYDITSSRHPINPTIRRPRVESRSLAVIATATNYFLFNKRIEVQSPVMPSRRPPRPAMYNTPQIRNGGFGALQVEAVTNRPLSIARRHMAASQLRMRDIEPDELSSSEWVRFLVMEERERDRWMTEFRRRRSSGGSSSSGVTDRETPYDKAEEARQEAEQAARDERRALMGQSSSTAPPPSVAPTGATPSVTMWARQFDERNETGESPYSARRPRHIRRAVTDGIMEAPPTYESAVRARTPPPAYEAPPDDDDDGGPTSPGSPRQV